MDEKGKEGNDWKEKRVKKDKDTLGLKNLKGSRQRADGGALTYKLYVWSYFCVFLGNKNQLQSTLSNDVIPSGHVVAAWPCMHWCIISNAE